MGAPVKGLGDELSLMIARKERKESEYKMNKKLVGLVATVLALSVIGFGYAYWTETLKIEGSVATGELDVEFLSIDKSCSDYMTCTVDGIDTDLDYDIDKLVVTASGGYPSGWCNVTFVIHNCGSIPAHVKTITITSDPQLTATLTGIVVSQKIAVSENVACKLEIHVEGTAAENTTYTASVTIEFDQGT